MKMQQDLQELQERLSMELDQETASYNNALRDSLQSFLKAFNKDKGFKLILSKAGDNMLLADPTMDITKEVVEGLNKAYKPTPELQNAGSAGTVEAK